MRIKGNEIKCELPCIKINVENLFQNCDDCSLIYKEADACIFGVDVSFIFALIIKISNIPHLIDIIVF